MRFRRLFALLTLLSPGCFGGAANPSYFPFYLPPGDVIATHAKPAGQGYFNDFDPKAASIEVTPTQCNAAVGGDHVLIATVFDADGQPRRKRRVEWILEGPGEILEVDESGITPGRGYGTNQRAVSYTGLRAHAFDRGTRDPADDFRVEAGQTWCILRSAKPGETVALAYHKAAPTREKADQLLDQRLKAPFTGDANDHLYQWESSSDYNPSPQLEKIQAAVLAINSADDERNPPETGVMDREIRRLKNGRYFLIPASEQTAGHGTTAQARFWKAELVKLLK